ncbi:MAG: hypothetical protein ACPHGY_10705 [Rhodospirillaceae bacterium]
MSIGGSSPKPQYVTQTTNTAPWDKQQPYLEEAFQEAQTLYNSDIPQYYEGATVAPLSTQTQTALDLTQKRAELGSPLVDQAQDQLLATMRGDYLNSNPYLQSAIDAASSGLVRNYQEAIRPGIDSSFERAGRYGSNAYQTMQDQAQDTLAKNLGNISSQLSYGDYSRERNLQDQAMRLAPSLSQADYNDAAQLARVGSIYDAQSQAELAADIDRFNFEQTKPYNKLGQYLAMVQGGYGGTQNTSTPYFTNRGANVLSGALGGLGAAGALGGGMGDFGTWGLGALGALGGLL